LVRAAGIKASKRSTKDKNNDLASLWREIVQ